MPLKFIGKPRIEVASGDVQILAYAGEFPVMCLIKRSAVTAGLSEYRISDAQTLELYHLRAGELQSIASQRFYNGEREPVVTRRDMSMH
jgi:hypothetical protein